MSSLCGRRRLALIGLIADDRLGMVISYYWGPCAWSVLVWPTWETYMLLLDVVSFFLHIGSRAATPVRDYGPVSSTFFTVSWFRRAALGWVY